MYPPEVKGHLYVENNFWFSVFPLMVNGEIHDDRDPNAIATQREARFFSNVRHKMRGVKGCRMGRSDTVSLWYVPLLINTRFRFFFLF